MASDELKEIRKNLTKEAVRDHQMATTGGTQTDLFTCGKCKGKNCTYTQVPTTTPPQCTCSTYVIWSNHFKCFGSQVWHQHLFSKFRYRLAALMSPWPRLSSAADAEIDGRYVKKLLFCNYCSEILLIFCLVSSMTAPKGQYQGVAKGILFCTNKSESIEMYSTYRFKDSL